MEQFSHHFKKAMSLIMCLHHKSVAHYGLYTIDPANIEASKPSVFLSNLTLRIAISMERAIVVIMDFVLPKVCCV